MTLRLIQTGPGWAAIQLPVSTGILNRVLGFVADEPRDQEQIFDLVDADPGLFILACKWLAGIPTKQKPGVGDLPQAVFLSQQLLQSNAVRSARYWQLVEENSRHSQAIAIACEVICRHMNRSRSGSAGRERQAYAAGLLSGIGYLQLLADFGDSYIEFLGSCSSVPFPELCEIEAQKFGSHRFARGGLLLRGCADQAWLSDAIEFQVKPAEELRAAHSLVQILALGRYLATFLVNDIPGGDYRSVESHGLCGIDSADFEQILAECQRSFATARALREVCLEPDQALVLDANTRRAAMIAGMADVLHSAENGHDWFAGISGFARQVFAADACLLFDCDERDSRLRGSPLCHDIAGFDLDLKDCSGRLNQAVTEGRPVLFGLDGVGDLLDLQLLRVSGAVQLIYLPLRHGDHLRGILALGFSEVRVADAEIDWLTLLRSWGHMIARLYRIESPGSQGNPRESLDTNYYRFRARELAHEVNNPLSIVQNYLKILSLKLAEEDATQQDLSTISTEIQRISGFVSAFGRIGDADSEVCELVELNKIVRNIVNMFKGATGIRFSIQLDDEVSKLKINQDAIKQILINLLKNATEALGDTGNIVVSTCGSINISGRTYVELKVSDDGPGVPSEIKSGLFAAAISSKGMKNDGLGLTIVRNLVDEMSGLISFRSVLGQGTDIQIFIPENIGVL